MRAQEEIHLLNTHSSVLFHVLKDYFSLSNIEMNKEIFRLYEWTKLQLSEKGICYKQLNPALVPSTKKYKEFALIFDRYKINDGMYGWEIFKRVLPFLSKKSTQSFRAGDMIANHANSDIIKEALFEKMKVINATSYKHPDQYYVIYINHTTCREIDVIERALEDYSPYVGCIDLTFHCKLKVILSVCLSSVFIKHKHYIIQSHPSDIDDSENINMIGYDFSAYDFVCVSINEMSYSAFLNYRINAGYIENEESIFSLLSISEKITPLSECTVIIPEEKFSYLKKEKTEILQRLEIESISDIQRIIKNNLPSSCLYNLRYSQEYAVSMFNVFAESVTRECHPAKSIVSLKYLPNEKKISLVTLI